MSARALTGTAPSAESRADESADARGPTRVASPQDPGETVRLLMKATLLLIVSAKGALAVEVARGDLVQELSQCPPSAPSRFLEARLEGRGDAPAVDLALAPHALHGSASSSSPSRAAYSIRRLVRASSASAAASAAAARTRSMWASRLVRGPVQRSRGGWAW